jgi:glycosyltransferase involved in cell wall biosynthesis
MLIMHILFLIRALSYGGAQRQLVTLANALVGQGRAVTLAVYYPQGELSKSLDEKVSLVSLNKKNRWDLLGFYTRLIKLVRRKKPDFLYSFMETANITSVLIRLFCPGIRVIWGKRNTLMDLANYGWIAWVINWLECRLAKFADYTIYNSHAGMGMYIQAGFPRRNSCVIMNGFDTDYFQPDPKAGKEIRQEWQVEPQHCLIGIVGRLDPMKGHLTFLRAASRLVQTNTNIRFVFVGEGVETYRKSLEEMSYTLGLAGRLIWAGARLDMPSVYSALDVLVSSSSYGEAFSNTIGEAMACGVPCIVTDVGDSARIVSDLGIVVPSKNPEALAFAMEEMLARLPEIDHHLLRQRIVEDFSVSKMVQSTLDLMNQLCMI